MPPSRCRTRCAHGAACSGNDGEFFDDELADPDDPDRNVNEGILSGARPARLR
jgi:hypothetical protein